jgi:AcrR family transcriptional regulator
MRSTTAQANAFGAPERGDAARKKLIDAGLKIFSEAGYEGASTRSLAAEAGVNVAAIPYYFRSKEGLYLAVIDHIADNCRKGLGEGIAKIKSTLADKTASREDYRALLDDYMRTHIRFVLQEGSKRSQISSIFSREQLDPTPAFGRIYDGFVRDQHETLAALVARVVGPHVAKDDVKLLTQTLLCQVSGFKLSRQTVLRTMGWKNYREKGVDEIERALMFHLDVILDAYRRKASAP